MSLSNDRRNQILKIPIPKSTELSKLPTQSFAFEKLLLTSIFKELLNSNNNSSSPLPPFLLKLIA